VIIAAPDTTPPSPPLSMIFKSTSKIFKNTELRDRKSTVLFVAFLEV
jgi:hypothetical protein